MSVDVITKDCTALSDSEIAELADLCQLDDTGYEVGVLSKQAEAWVLVTLARSDEALRGFSFCTLERIGGTPSVLLGFGVIGRGEDSSAVLQAIMDDQMRRAVLAFPDEDVVVATRMTRAAARAVFGKLEDIIPRPDHKASGEERAWGRRLVKRFGIEAANYDDRAFVVRGDGTISCQLDYDGPEGDEVPAEVNGYFEGLDPANGDVLITFGWAMAEYLDSMLPS